LRRFGSHLGVVWGTAHLGAPYEVGDSMQDRAY
jgi:hypothetical protein